jgi:hypothetical protein
VKILTWNVFHGRDDPPDPPLFTLRSRLLGRTEDNGQYLQVNRSLQHEFAAVIAEADWSICLLQETPPPWARSLAELSGAHFFRTLTSRNELLPLTRLVARSIPDLIGAWEGGSNLTLVRPPWRLVEGGGRSLLLNPLGERGLGERRRMSFVRVRFELAGEPPSATNEHGSELCIANLHASGRRLRAEGELRRAAEAAADWAGDAPLVLGGDFNMRPETSRELFAELEHEFGLGPPTGPSSIDHLLSRGLTTVTAPIAWSAGRRELEVAWKAGRRRIRLSDHAPVEAVFGVPRATPPAEPGRKP